MTQFQTGCVIFMALALAGVIVCLVVWWIPGVVACIVMGYIAMILGMVAE